MSENEDSKNRLFRDMLSRCEERSRYLGNLLRETIKYFTTIFSSLTTAAIAAKILVLNYGIERYFHYRIGEYLLNVNVINIMVASIEIIALITVIVGLMDIKRVYERDLENNATLNKIRFYLGLYDEIIEERRFYKKDPSVFSERYLSRKWDSSEDFIREMRDWRKRKHPLGTVIGIFSSLFYVYILSAVFLVIIFLLV